MFIITIAVRHCLVAVYYNASGTTLGGHDGGQWPHNLVDYNINYDFDSYQDTVYNDGWHHMGDFELALDEPYRGGLL